MSDRAFLLGMLDHLLDRAASWLRFSRLAARGLKVSLRYGDYTGEEGRVALRPASNEETRLKTAGRERLLRLYQRRLPLRFLGIELSPLVTPQHQPELFPDPLAEREHRLAECKDAVRRRFGFMALVSGTALVVSEQTEHDRENFRLRTPCLTR
jgi:DNA polymerase IV